MKNVSRDFKSRGFPPVSFLYKSIVLSKLSHIIIDFMLKHVFQSYNYSGSFKFKLTVFIFIIGVYEKNKTCHELNHEFWVKPYGDPLPCELREIMTTELQL